MKLKRFLDAQNQVYLRALSEIRNGKKVSHWMWYVFPQLKGLGKSETANEYGIFDLAEANSYLAHPVLGKHLIEISEALLKLNSHTAEEIFGYPDNLKLRSCMTLFAAADNAHPVFSEVLEKYYASIPDGQTIKMLEEERKKNNTI